MTDLAVKGIGSRCHNLIALLSSSDKIASMAALAGVTTSGSKEMFRGTITESGANIAAVVPEPKRTGVAITVLMMRPPGNAQADGKVRQRSYRAANNF